MITKSSKRQKTLTRCFSLKNKQGKTIQIRLTEEIEYAESVKSAEQREILAIKALGAVDLAVEFGMITYNEWTTYIERIFKMM